MIGSRVPIGILERKSIPNGSGGFILGASQSGNIAEANILFETPANPEFTAITAGKFLVIFNTETKRQQIAVAVSAPASAAIARNENTWRPLSVDQVMSCSYAFSAGAWNVASSVIQERNYMPFEHVSHSFLVDLAANEKCILNVTSGASDRKWMLCAMRMLNFTLEERNRNVLALSLFRPTISNTSGTTTSEITQSTDNVRKWHVRCVTGTSSQSQFSYGRPRSGVAFVAKVELSRSSNPAFSSIAGSVTVQVRKDATVLATTTMAIPLAGFTRWEISIASGVFTGSEEIVFVVSDLVTGERFDIEMKLEVE